MAGSTPGVGPLVADNCVVRAWPLATLMAVGPGQPGEGFWEPRVRPLWPVRPRGPREGTTKQGPCAPPAPHPGPPPLHPLPTIQTRRNHVLGQLGSDWAATWGLRCCQLPVQNSLGCAGGPRPPSDFFFPPPLG